METELSASYPYLSSDAASIFSLNLVQQHQENGQVAMFLKNVQLSLLTHLLIDIHTILYIELEHVFYRLFQNASPIDSLEHFQYYGHDTLPLEVCTASEDTSLFDLMLVFCVRATQIAHLFSRKKDSPFN
jgi:hypothetical protein